MNPKMMREEELKTQRRLAEIQQVTQGPHRYMAFVEKHGTALGKAYKTKLKAA